MEYKIAVVTQTPLIKFNKNYSSFRKSIKLEDLDSGDYQYTVGGVSNMEKVLIKKLIEDRFAKKVYWFSLNPNAPENLVLDKKQE